MTVHDFYLYSTTVVLTFLAMIWSKTSWANALFKFVLTGLGLLGVYQCMGFLNG